MWDDRKPSAALPRIMRAVQVGAFGGIEQLHLSSIPVPMPRRGEVLVRVCAAGVGVPPAPAQLNHLRFESASLIVCCEMKGSRQQSNEVSFLGMEIR